jgi:hypothetical protein
LVLGCSVLERLGDGALEKHATPDDANPTFAASANFPYLARQIRHATTETVAESGIYLIQQGKTRTGEIDVNESRICGSGDGRLLERLCTQTP